MNRSGVCFRLPWSWEFYRPVFVIVWICCCLLFYWRYFSVYSIWCCVALMWQCACCYSFSRTWFVRLNKSSLYCRDVHARLSVRVGHACIVIVPCSLSLIKVYGLIVQCSGHPDTKACPVCPPMCIVQPSFSSSTWKIGGVWMCKLGVVSQKRLKVEVKLLLSARKSYAASKTTDDLEWPWMFKLTMVAY